jgi:hypothetical protein
VAVRERHCACVAYPLRERGKRRRPGIRIVVEMAPRAWKTSLVGAAAVVTCAEGTHQLEIHFGTLEPDDAGFGPL